jgi:hypothetical protein
MFSRSLTAAALALLCTAPSAYAQTAAPAIPDTSPAPAALTPVPTPAEKARLAPRRPTAQIVASPLPTVTDGYRPTLTTPPANASGMPNPVGTLPVSPTTTPSANAAPAPLPVPVTNCTAGGCTGADGVRYNTGAAGVTVDPAGRTCRKIGNTMQC